MGSVQDNRTWINSRPQLVGRSIGRSERRGAVEQGEPAHRPG